MYLLDTNICSQIIRQATPSILQRLEDNKAEDIYISQITVSELFYGCERTNDVEANKAALEKFLLPFDLLAYDYEAAEIYGALRAGLEKTTATPVKASSTSNATTPNAATNVAANLGPFDLMLAAQALSHDLVLVSNSKIFRLIPALKSEVWTVPSTPRPTRPTKAKPANPASSPKTKTPAQAIN